MSLQHTRKNQLKYTEDIEIVEQSDSDEENFQPSGNSEIMKLNYHFTTIRYYLLKNFVQINFFFFGYYVKVVYFLENNW